MECLPVLVQGQTSNGLQLHKILSCNYWESFLVVIFEIQKQRRGRPVSPALCLCCDL